MMIASAILAALSLALSTNGTSVVVSAVGRERVSVGTVGAAIKRTKGDVWGLQFTPTNVVCSGEGRWTLSFRSKNAAEAKEAALSAVAETRGDEIEFRFKLTPLNGGRILCDKLRSIGLRVADGIDFVQPNWPGIWHRDAKGGVPYETCGCRIPGYEADDGILYLAYPQAASWTHDPNSARQFLWTPEPDGAASFAMRLHWFAGGDAAWIMSAVETNAVAALRIVTDRDFNLFTAPERPSCRIELVGSRAGRRTLAVEAEAWDFDGKKVATLSEPVALEKWERKAFALQLPEGVARGIWFVEARVKDGAEEVFCRTDVAVLPPHKFRHRDTTMMGMAAYFNVPSREAVFRLMQRMGVKWLRPHNWEDPLDYAKWGFAGVCNRGPNRKIPATNEVARREYVRDVLKKTVASGCSILEEGNELNFGGSVSQKNERAVLYAEWAKLFYEERAKLGLEKKLKLSTFGFAGGDEVYMSAFGRAKGFDSVDILSVHPGRLNQTADAPGPAWAWYYRAALQLGNGNLAKFGNGRPKELILTETYARTPPNGRGSDSMRVAAETVFLSCAIAKAENVSILHWYQLHDGRHDRPRGINEKDSEFHYGLLLREGAVKPSFMAYCAISEILDGAEFVGERTWVSDARRAWYFRSPERGPFAVLVDRADGYFPYPTKAEDFKGHRDPWLEHWKTRNRYRFETGAKTVSVVDVLGRESKVRAKDGSVELTLSGSPIAVYGLEM